MTARRLSKLQRQILHRMWTQYERTQGGISTDHLDLVKALGRDKSNVSHSLRTLQTWPRHTLRQWFIKKVGFFWENTL